MHIDVAFTPAEEASARVGIVVDVIRATSSIAQALASGYERVLCCAQVDLLDVAPVLSRMIGKAAEIRRQS